MMVQYSLVMILEFWKAGVLELYLSQLKIHYSIYPLIQYSKYINFFYFS